MINFLKIVPTIWLLVLTLSAKAQEGFYAGAGWNTYTAREQVRSSENQIQFSHSTTSSKNGFITQALGEYGFGIFAGIKKEISTKEGKNVLTIDVQYCYNYQNVLLENTFETFKIKTKAKYNHGFRLAFGHRFRKIHPYLIVQGYFQNVTPFNSAINNGGFVYDVDDNGEILASTLDDDGDDFTTEVFSFLGAFGVDVPLSEKCVLHVEYIPVKHVEYGIREMNSEGAYFLHDLVVNQLQVGVKFYFWDVFRRGKN